MTLIAIRRDDTFDNGTYVNPNTYIEAVVNPYIFESADKYYFYKMLSDKEIGEEHERLLTLEQEKIERQEKEEYKRLKEKYG